MSQPTGEESKIQSQAYARRIALSVVLLVTSAVYLRFKSRGFTSEDFLLLRFLSQNPPWQDPVALFTEPWLGISVVQFYRPLAISLLALEEALFGVHPLPYNLVHLSLHLLSVTFVSSILGRIFTEPGKQASILAVFVGTSVFALYPLHPNAVSWVASYASVYGNTLILLALSLYVRNREHNKEVNRRSLTPAILAFALALACYESSVLFPLFVVGYEVLIQRSSARRTIAVGLMFGSFSLLYLLIRRAVLGVTIGGYEWFDGSLLDRLGEWSHGLGRSLYQLPWPRYVERGPTSEQGNLALIVFLLVTGSCFVFWIAKRNRLGGSIVFAAVLVVSSMAPFAFRAVWPAEGRYWYLASLAVAILVTAAVTQASTWSARMNRRVHGGFAVVLSLAPLLYLPGLLGHLGWMKEAALEARAIQSALLEYDLPDESPLFIAEVPMFVTNASDVNLAQIHHYGLADSLAPPFSSRSRSIYPVHGPARAAAAALEKVGPVLVWNENQLSDVSGPAELVEGELVISSVRYDQGVESGVQRVEFQRSDRLLGAKLEMVVATAGNSTRVRIPNSKSQTSSATLPRVFIGSMATLYPNGRRFVWIEARNHKGRLLAVAPAHSF